MQNERRFSEKQRKNSDDLLTCASKAASLAVMLDSAATLDQGEVPTIATSRVAHKIKGLFQNPFQGEILRVFCWSGISSFYIVLKQQLARK